MVGTDRLYYSEPGISRAKARILSREGDSANPVLVLDRTLFYPEGGGQPCDLGTINGIALVSVTMEGATIKHKLASPLAAGSPDSVVDLVLDEPRRRDHAEQHTGQHLLSAVLSRLYGAETRGFHLGAERSTIDVSLSTLDEGGISEAEAAVNEVILENYPVTVHLCPPEDLSSFPLRKGPPESEAEIRVVEIDGIDYSPCCGTHLSSTGPLRIVKILGVERYKGMSRIAFVAGDRALADYSGASRRIREASRLLGASVEILPEEVAKLIFRLKETLSSAESLFIERAALEAELALLRRSMDGEKASAPLVFRYADRDATAAEAVARAAAGLGRTALALSVPSLTLVAQTPSGSIAGGLSRLLKPLSEARGGRGGGGETGFRASFRDADSLEAFLDDTVRALGGY